MNTALRAFHQDIVLWIEELIRQTVRPHLRPAQAGGFFARLRS